MSMDRYTELSIFLVVVEKGSFSAAARALTLSPSAVSKSISRQEARLGVRLFNRNSRSVRPTPEGAALYASGTAVREAMDVAESSVSAFGAVPAGLLRIHALPMLAKYRLAPLLPEFLSCFPQVSLKLQLSVEPPDPVLEDVDVILRSGTWNGPGLISRRIGHSRMVVCASPDYLRRRGIPQTPSDLAQHNCLLRRDVHAWNFRVGGVNQLVHVNGNVVANESEMLLALARAGVGIMSFSENVVAADLASGALVAVLTDFKAGADSPVYVAYQNRRHLNPRIRVFIDFLIERFR